MYSSDRTTPVPLNDIAALVISRPILLRQRLSYKLAVVTYRKRSTGNPAYTVHGVLYNSAII